MKVTVESLGGCDLDLWVAKALGLQVRDFDRIGVVLERPIREDMLSFRPTEDWADGGPIIEQERIAIYKDGSGWSAYADGYNTHDGIESRTEDGYCWDAETPLLAAMRAYVKSKFGPEVEVA